MKATPLLGFLRSLNVEQQNQFAASVGTTRVYLYQLAGQANPNPRLALAKALVEESQRWAPRVMTRALTYDDLLVGNTEADQPS